MFALQVSPGRPRAEAHMWGKGGAHPHRDQQINTVDSVVKRRNLHPNLPQVTAKSPPAELRPGQTPGLPCLFPMNLDVFRPESDSKKSVSCADGFLNLATQLSQCPIEFQLPLCQHSQLGKVTPPLGFLYLRPQIPQFCL